MDVTGAGQLVTKRMKKTYLQQAEKKNQVLVIHTVTLPCSLLFAVQKRAVQDFQLEE